MSASPQPPLVSIIIPVFNLWDYTLRCLFSIMRHTAHIPHEVIVVDDASTDETKEGLPLLEGIRVIRNERNRGFAWNNNKAAAAATGKYLLFLNNDTEVQPRWLDEMLAVIEGLDNVGVVGCKLLFPDGSIQHAGVAFSYCAPRPISPFHMHYGQPADVSTKMLDLNAVTAACSLMPRDLFHRLGGFDEEFRMGYEDVDLCLRVREAGHRVVYTPNAVVTHYESLSEGRFVDSGRNEEILNAKWIGRFDRFESDFRTLGLPTPPSTGRPGVSVVVAVHDQLIEAPPCIENVFATLSANDELIIIDDGGVGATAKYLQAFANTHADRCKLIRLPTYQGLAAAWQVGLAHAKHPYAAFVVCAWRVLEGWLDRFVKHLQTNPLAAAVCASAADGGCRFTPDLLTPIPHHLGGLALPPALPPGTLDPTPFLLSGVVMATRDTLAELLNEHPEGIPGGAPQAWSQSLNQQGRKLAAARDVTAYPIVQVFPDSGLQPRTQYLVNLSAMWGVPTARDLSVIMVARDHEAAFGQALQALLRHTPQGFELIVIDDGSATSLRATFDNAVANANVRATFISHDRPQTFPISVNEGLALATAPNIVVMNGDVVVTERWLPPMLALLQVNPNIGIVCPMSNVGPRPQRGARPKYFDKPDTIDVFADHRRANHFATFGAMPRFGGFCFLVRRGVIHDVGGFDAGYGDGGGDVEDFCVRFLRRGYIAALAAESYVESLGCLPERWVVVHPRRPPTEGWLRFCARWNHPPQEADQEGLLRVFSAAGGFDPRTDYVPLPSALTSR